MEAKTLLRLIKDDITHLEGITSDFLLESLPSSDEVELALVRAKALLRELELLHKISVQHESISVAIKPAEETKIEASAYQHSEQEPFELFESENSDDGQKTELIPDLYDLTPSEAVPVSDLNTEDKYDTEAIPEIPANEMTADEHFSALVEPIESFNTEIISPVVEEMKIEEHLIIHDEPLETGNLVQESPIIIEEEVSETLTVLDEPIETVIETIEEPVDNLADAAVDLKILETEASTTVETEIVSEIQDHKEEILAEEFKEVKKTLNETLGDSHQMVNDILSSEKDETGYKIIPINSIWDGIGINDRFLFIRELFANSSAKFENTITALDKLATIHDAVNYLKMNFKWNKTEASQKFLVLVKRRFTK